MIYVSTFSKITIFLWNSVTILLWIWIISWELYLHVQWYRISSPIYCNQHRGYCHHVVQMGNYPGYGFCNLYLEPRLPLPVGIISWTLGTLPLNSFHKNIPSNLQYKLQLLMQYNCWSLRYSWSIAFWCCSNYILIFNLILCFNGLGKYNYKTRWENLNFGIWCGLY